MKSGTNISVVLTDVCQLHRLAHLGDYVNLVEVRRDIFDFDLEEIKKVTGADLLFSLKSEDNGGFFRGSEALRIREFREASSVCDFFELEAGRDLIPEILDIIPPEKRIISWRGNTENYENLAKRYKKYQAVAARYYQLVICAKKSGDEIPVLQLLKNNSRNDLIAYATGPAGLWTQPLSAFLGSQVVPSSLNGEVNINYFSPEQLIENYNLPYTYPVKLFFGIVGNPVFGSISPKLHNGAFRALNLPYLYLPFQTNTLQDFFDEVVNKDTLPIEFSGLTVVAPFKEAGLITAGKTSDPDVTASEASNLMLNRKRGGWVAKSTDALGVIDALDEMAADWKLKSIVIVGCGGTGKTVAAALKRMKAKLTLVNRTVDKGLKIARALNLPFIPLDRFNPADFDVIIHATPLGKNKGEAPFDITLLKNDCIVIDHVYSLTDVTDLVKYCRLCNIPVADGVEMAEFQIKHQFRLMTSRKMILPQKRKPITK